MAWPKRGTRTITVDNVRYLWHYAACCPWCHGDVFTVGMAGKPYVLYIDPFPWEIEIRPASVAKAIQWATQHDWTPDKGPTQAMSFDDTQKEFIWLPDGQRHLYCRNKSPFSDIV